MNKAKLFIENFLVYGLGGVISKIVPVIMVPIITRIMPNSTYFGIQDMSNTIVSFASALALLGMYDAMYRMFFEKDDVEYKKDVCSTALMFTICTSITVFLIMIFLKEQISKWFFSDNTLSYVIYLSALATLVGASNRIISAPTRMQNKRTIFLFTNTLSPILSYGIAIPLLLRGYYIIALPLATLLSGLTLELSFLALNHSWFSIKRFNKELLFEMLKIAFPLIPNFLIYWIFNSSDRLMITRMLSIGDEGIYSVGSKFGQVSQLIYIAFAGGWQFFAFSTMNDKDQVKSNSRIFEYLGVVSFVATAFVCALAHPLYQLLFKDAYVKGYIVAPYLFLAPLMQMLFQVACNQLIIAKKTWPNMFILSGGAVLNILLNLVLIPLIGIEGAAISTLIGYAVSDFVVVIVLSKINLMTIEKRFYIATISMIAIFLVWRFFVISDMLIGIIIAIIFSIICAHLFRGDIKNLYLIVKENI